MPIFKSNASFQLLASNITIYYLSRPMSSTSSSHTIVSDSVGLEPIDYEEYVSNHSERDPLSQVSISFLLFGFHFRVSDLFYFDSDLYRKIWIRILPCKGNFKCVSPQILKVKILWSLFSSEFFLQIFFSSKFKGKIS